jgi:hypothetical protein
MAGINVLAWSLMTTTPATAGGYVSLTVDASCKGRLLESTRSMKPPLRMPTLRSRSDWHDGERDSHQIACSSRPLVRLQLQ